MSPTLQRVIVKAFGAKDGQLTVLGSTSITPHYHRVDVDLGDFLQRHGVHPTMWLRLWFDDGGKAHQRAFTLVEPDVDTGRAGLEFALHAGVAAQWAVSARPGERLDFSLLGSKCPWAGESPAAGSTWERTVLIGGMACVPAINALLDLWPDAPVTVLLEHDHDDDAVVPVRSRPAHDVEWFDAGDDDAVLRRVGELADPTTRFWVTTEASRTRAIVKKLKTEHGMAKEQIVAQAYWNLSD